jgi:hypothetical protein
MLQCSNALRRNISSFDRKSSDAFLQRSIQSRGLLITIW